MLSLFHEGGEDGPSSEGVAAPEVIDCDLSAQATVRVPLDVLAGLRRKPGPPFGVPLAPTFLKHADVQTVVCVTAIHQAIHDHGLTGPFRDWGALAAPRYLGRPALGVALPRFLAEGAWGVSPHIIPHHSLHAVSGTLSQALKMHGPNFGVGGGPGGVTEALLAATALLHGKGLPGVWVVFSRLGPETVLGENGAMPPEAFAEALALALTPASANRATVRLRLTVGPGLGEALAPGAPFDLDALLGLLGKAKGGERACAQPIGWGACLELTNFAAPQVRPSEAQEGAVFLQGPGLFRAGRRSA